MLNILCQFTVYCSLSIASGIFDQKGKLLGSASSPIQIWKEKDCIEVENCSWTCNVLHTWCMQEVPFSCVWFVLYPAILDGYLACSLCCSEICLLTGKCCSWGSCRPWFRRYLLPWFVLNSIIFCIIMCGGQRLTFKWKGSFCVSGLSIGFYQLNTIICCL